MNEQIKSHRGSTLPVCGDPVRLGRRRFLVGAGALAGAGAVSSILPSGLVEAALPAGASSFTPLPAAVRVADTRFPAQAVFTRISPQHIRVQVKNRAGVPASASAVVLTATAVNWSEPNWVAVYPSGTNLPTVSNLNMVRGPGEVTANLVTVKVGADHSVDLYQRMPCDVIVDLLGYYTPVSGAVKAGRFKALAEAARAIDTRQSFGFARSGSFTPVDLTGLIPADASSVVINLTATECTGPGHFSALPATADETKQPTTSSLNVTYAGDTRAASVIVPLPTINGRRILKIYTHTAAKLIVDVNGFFTSGESPLSSEGLFVPLTPQRILDTRWPGEIGKLWPSWVVERRLPSAVAPYASSIVVNVTGDASRGPGYFTVSAAQRALPATSNVNWMIAGATVPNHVITPVTATHGFQVYSSHGAHVIVDLAGYFTGSSLIPNVAPYQNPPPPAAPPNWVMHLPRLGKTSIVREGDPRAITDAGDSWHWTGTGYMGQSAHVAVFAHRTEHGGPYRYLHLLAVGDTFTVTTTDNRVYVYRVAGRTMVRGNSSAGPSVADILAATRAYPGTTMSLIACTLSNWLPTSLWHRIVVTGELIDWYEI